MKFTAPRRHTAYPDQIIILSPIVYMTYQYIVDAAQRGFAETLE